MNLTELLCRIFRLPNIIGKNNKIILRKDGKEQKIIFLPRGLYIYIRGNNNVCKISYPHSFANSKIIMKRDNNIFELGYSMDHMKNATFRIEDGGIFKIGNNCQFYSGNFFGICYNSHNIKHKIEIGNNVLFAQDVIVRCGDGHTVFDTNTKLPLNEPQDIIIDDNVWITSRCILLKKTHIPEGSIVAANSVVNKCFNNKNILIGGSPAKLLKQDISWNRASYCDYVKNIEGENV